MDNLRVFVIVFVVVQHVASIYSGYGLDLRPALPPMELDVPSNTGMGFFLTFCQSYDMALLFMLAGFFIRGSYDRKGFGPFVKARFMQLMIPAFLTMAVITPFQHYVELGGRWFEPEKGFLALIVRFLDGINVMWFVVALFIFSLAYALVRRLGGNISRKYNVKLSFRNAVVLILIIAVCAFLIRLKFPIGAFYAGMTLGYFASYIAFFIVGVAVSQSDVLEKIRYKTGVVCLVCGIVFGFAAWGGIMLQSGVLDGVWSYRGGLNMASAVFALWESTVAVVMIIGLVGVFKEKLNHQRKFGAWMSDNSFAVYMFHLQILIAVALLVRPLDMPPVVKWLATSAVCLPLCYGAAHFIFRKIPLLKKIL
jgi:hypothetical protein